MIKECVLCLQAAVACVQTYLPFHLFTEYLCQQREPGKWRRARSSVPEIGAANSAVNTSLSFWVCNVMVYFHASWRPAERWHDQSSHMSGESVPHLPQSPLASPDDTVLIAPHPRPVLLAFCLRIRSCYWSHCELQRTRLVLTVKLSSQINS